MTSYASAYVAAGPVVDDACPNGCGPSMLAEWTAISDGGTLVVGHSLACPECRPEGVWSCTFCPELLALDGPLVREHLMTHFGGRQP